jgi:manganese/zinc/iron transport system substrate-binding protein
MEVAGIQGVSTAAEATTADIERIAALIVSRQLPAVFVESSVPRQTIDALVAAAERQGVAVRVGQQLFTDAAGTRARPRAPTSGCCGRTRSASSPA